MSAHCHDEFPTIGTIIGSISEAYYPPMQHSLALQTGRPREFQQCKQHNMRLSWWMPAGRPLQLHASIVQSATRWYITISTWNRRHPFALTNIHASRYRRYNNSIKSLLRDLITELQRLLATTTLLDYSRPSIQRRCILRPRRRNPKLMINKAASGQTCKGPSPVGRCIVLQLSLRLVRMMRSLRGLCKRFAPTSLQPIVKAYRVYPQHINAERAEDMW